MQWYDYYNAIAALKSSTPDYETLLPIWRKALVEEQKSRIKARYESLLLSDDEAMGIASIDVANYMKNLSEIEVRTRLDAIHKQIVQVSIAQLQAELDKLPHSYYSGDKPHTIAK